jgi:uncharacterized SAM-binding protein YcdF (DUF218 family)
VRISLESAISQIRRACVTALAALGLLYVFVSATPIVNWWGHGLAGSFTNRKGQILIVLGGGTLEPGMMGLSSYWRAIYAIRAYETGGFQKIVIAGGGSPEPVSVAMKQFMVCQSVPSGSIVTDTWSTSTRENALAVRRLLSNEGGEMVLLTSDYHMFRARRVFAKAGLRVLPGAFPDAVKAGQTWQNRWPVFLELCAETVKIGYYYARGWM